MSMDYKKTVYRARRSNSVNRTSYNEMNHWQKYRKPICLTDRPPLPIGTVDVGRLPKGVELQVPIAGQPTAEQIELIRKRQKVALRNQREVMERENRSYKPPNNPFNTASLLPPIRSDSDPQIHLAGKFSPAPQPQHPYLAPPPVHLGYFQGIGYDDYHKTYLKLKKDGVYASYPLYGPPQVRAGNGGGSWRHVTETLQAGGDRRIFIDGMPTLIDYLRLRQERVPAGNVFHPVKRGGKPAQSLAPHITSDAYMGLAKREQERQTEGANFHLVR